jgi:hypothetical protein
MAANHDDDPSAFPLAVPETSAFYNQGMSLRDYFAGQALSALLQRTDVRAIVTRFAARTLTDEGQNEMTIRLLNVLGEVADTAYLAAACMLTSREEPEE